ncbi:MAG: glycosyltransferase [Bacteroidia bacterium]|nr:glycosyltransferase [Bacteroidia bacterium]
MKVSIITTVLSNRKCLSDAMESVLNQVHDDIEYIIVDGGSTDGTVELIRSYGNKVTKFLTEPDEGMYDALNKGIQMATGDIIAIINSDDFYVNRHVISQVVHAFEEHKCDAVYSNLYYISNTDKEKIIRTWDAGRYHYDSFYKGWMPPHPAFFVKREVYQKYGSFNTRLKLSADYELMLRFILKHKIKIYYLPKFFIKMRVGGNSNRNLTNRLKANMEDREAWKINKIKPGFFTLLLKPFSKIFQYRMN